LISAIIWFTCWAFRFMAALHQRLPAARLLAPGPDPPDPPAGDERSGDVGLEKRCPHYNQRPIKSNKRK
jgi:hypothetical protein